MNAENKIKLVIYVPPSMKEALEKLSAKTGAPVAESVRRAITAMLAKASKKGKA
jgi:predicted DNA-binding protein